MPSQIDPKTSLTPVHICSQLPVNKPINTSRTPVMTPSTDSMVLATFWNAPSKTGANKSQKPNQIDFSTSVMFSKSNPSALILSTMPSQKPDTVSLMLFQIPAILFRNPSLVLHKVANAPISTAIAATIATMGAVTPPKAAPNLLASPPSAGKPAFASTKPS